MQIKNIMSSDIVVVDKDQNLHDALKIMKKNKVSRLPVINTNNDKVKELVGMVTEKDIAQKLGSSKYGNLPPSHFHLSTVMTSELITAHPEMDLGTAANKMLENYLGGLPVMEDGEMVGIITKSDFIDNCRGKAYDTKLVEDFMSTEILSLDPQERIVHARRLMIDSKVSRLLVMEGEDLAGIITAKDIAESLIFFRKMVPDKHQAARIRNLLVEDVMTQNVHTISPRSTIAEAAQMMLDKGFSGFPVMDENNYLVGIITKTDLMDLIVEMEGVN
ncbi:MAG: CBS domain-containing protein [Euryarchaeota archaeon]|nr:CBS domain-containing protein [Euryarchaeota archaeon]MBU4608418.1 CBS domain-containing protein [Euryarchaeota archaeon]MBV1728821.1 CBS domain-containing protein [Methanobacterium sp.]MBV1755482.1 CBS domain-containing protein [Methanobacterium sp.]MBV1768263.1 CBS domain-containing protein [Methanobacterium sp.]